MNHFLAGFVSGFTIGFLVAAIIAVILVVLAVLSLTMDASDLPKRASKKVSLINYRHQKFLDR
jgi:hypothetical protein